MASNQIPNQSASLSDSISIGSGEPGHFKENWPGLVSLTVKRVSLNMCPLRRELSSSQVEADLWWRVVRGILSRKRRLSKACGQVWFKCVERPQLSGGTWGWGDPGVRSSHACEGAREAEFVSSFKLKRPVSN